jgi:hypothetical protein
MRNYFILLMLLLFAFRSQAQTDSSLVKKAEPRAYTHYDSVRLSKLNSSGNLMIAGGVGLCVAGGYLLYQGNKVYTTNPSVGSTNPSEETNRNHRQGTIYYVAGGIAAAGGILLTAFGARNKVEFKRQKRMMELQGGILDSGHLGLALNF